MSIDLEFRRKGIGGSDAAAACGMSRWSTPLQLYYEKLGELCPIQEDQSMEWGKKLEPLILQTYSEKTGREISRPSKPLISDKHPFMMANLDGYTLDGRVIEAKTSRSGAEWGDSDDIPIEYYFQVQHYMALTGFQVADIAVLIAGSDFRIYEIEANVKMQTLMIDREAAFWESVETGRPPKPTAVSDLMRFYRSNPGNVVATIEIAEMVDQIKKLRKEITDLEIQKEAFETEIKFFIGEKDTLVNENGDKLATWKASKPRNRIDMDRLKAEKPRIFKKYSLEGDPSRRFNLK